MRRPDPRYLQARAERFGTIVAVALEARRPALPMPYLIDTPRSQATRRAVLKQW